MPSPFPHITSDGDPFHYHQDYYPPSFADKLRHAVVPITLLLAVVVSQTLWYTGRNDLSVPQLLWNCLVYATPGSLLDMLEQNGASTTVTENGPRTHASKSESMRRLMGIDSPGGIVSTVTKASRRRLSGLPGMDFVSSASRRKLSILPGFMADDNRPPGLGNWDNSCYQNSVLQGLAALDSMGEYLQHVEKPKMLIEDPERRPPMATAESLRELIAQLNDPSNNGRRIWTPAVLKSMNSWQQQDAQEYFSKVLDEIDKEIAKAVQATEELAGLESLLDRDEGEGKSNSEDTSTSATKSFTATPRISTVRNPLEGLLAQRVGCTKCGYSEGLSMIPFNCLTVPLGRDWIYSIADCLSEYTKLEAIEGVECGKCTLLKQQGLLRKLLDNSEGSKSHTSIVERLKAVNEALEIDDYDDKTLLNKCKINAKHRVTTTKSRQAVIATPPRSLAIHVNRSLFDEFTGELKKNYADVRFPYRLDLGPWCLGSTGSSPSSPSSTEEWLLDPASPMVSAMDSPSRVRGPVYELRAIVIHYGRHENGHYISYRKHDVEAKSDGEEDLLAVSKEEQWWRLSDDDVSKVTQDNVLGQGGVFMLFYDCVEPARRVDTDVPASVSQVEDAAVSSTKANELEVAAAVPLPVENDDGLEDDEDRSEREESTAPSVSETDESEAVDRGHEEHYQPTKPIVVPQYVPSSGALNKVQSEENMRSAGNMVMV